MLIDFLKIALHLSSSRADHAMTFMLSVTETLSNPVRLSITRERVRQILLAILVH